MNPKYVLLLADFIADSTEIVERSFSRNGAFKVISKNEGAILVYGPFKEAEQIIKQIRGWRISKTPICFLRSQYGIVRGNTVRIAIDSDWCFGN